MQNYSIVVDCWEANVNLDEQTLLANGVRGLIIRMNDTVDREHLDENFNAQWAASSMFYRMPYFVFAPWMTVQAQVDFIIANLPAGCKSIALDVEVDAYTINPIKVAGDLCELMRRLQMLGLHVIIYSGSWYWQIKHIQVGLPWQAAADYWWAAYPYLFQPNNSRTATTWDALKGLIAKWVWDTAGSPGPCQLRQVCSRYALPGTAGLNIDINIFNGDETSLAAYFGGNVAPTPTPEPTPIPSPIPQLKIINCSFLMAHPQPDLKSSPCQYFTAGDLTTLLATQTVGGIVWYSTPKGWINSYYAKVTQ